jgi:hypothetical protein
MCNIVQELRRREKYRTDGWIILKREDYYPAVEITGHQGSEIYRISLMCDSDESIDIEGKVGEYGLYGLVGHELYIQEEGMSEDEVLNILEWMLEDIEVDSQPFSLDVVLGLLGAAGAKFITVDSVPTGQLRVVPHIDSTEIAVYQELKRCLDRVRLFDSIVGVDIQPTTKQLPDPSNAIVYSEGTVDTVNQISTKVGIEKISGEIEPKLKM